MLDRTLIRKVNNYLIGRYSLSEFYHWFVPNTWNSHKWENKELVALINKLQLHIYQFQDKLFNEAALKQKFQQELQSYKLNLNSKGEPTDGSSSIS